MVDSIKKVFGMSYPLTLITSMSFADGYYNYFNINITTYLRIDDLVLIFLNRALLIFYLIIIGCLWMVITATRSSLIPYVVGELKRKVNDIWSLIIFTILIGVIFIFFISAKFMTAPLGMAFLVVFFIGSFVVGIDIFLYRKGKGISTKEILLMLLAGFLNLIILPFCVALIFASNDDGIKVSIQFKNGNMINGIDSSNVVMIDKTNDYIFLYDKKDSTSKVLKMDAVNSIEYLKKIK